MRKPVIAGNWKMYKLIGESVDAALELKSLISNVNHCEIVVAPVFTALKTVADRLEGSNIKLAAQNCSTESEHGAHTGEVAADMIRDAGAELVIIGHSERRQIYGETDEIVSRKIRAARQAGLTAIVCVGETLPERAAGRENEIVAGQLARGLQDLTIADLNRILIAYEPVWAIGTGQTATPEQASAMHGFVRQRLENQFSADIAAEIRILYGGSVKSDNVKSLMAQPNIDGALVGGASLQVESFAKIVNYL